MYREVCFFTRILSLLLIVIGDLNVQAAGEVSVDKVELTSSTPYKVIDRGVSPENKYDLVFENTGGVPVKLCIKYIYKERYSHTKKRHYMHQVVEPGERIEIHNLNLKGCPEFVRLKIRLTSCRRKTKHQVLRPFYSDLAGAEGALTIMGTRR